MRQHVCTQMIKQKDKMLTINDVNTAGPWTIL